MHYDFVFASDVLLVTEFDSIKDAHLHIRTIKGMFAEQPVEENQDISTFFNIALTSLSHTLDIIMQHWHEIGRERLFTLSNE